VMSDAERWLLAGDDCTVSTAVQILRHAAAEAVDDDIFNRFKIYSSAGLSDYAFMKRCGTVAELQAALRASGLQVGLEDCIWANEFEISALATRLQTTALILDLQAAGSNRFVTIKPEPRPKSQTERGGEDGVEDGPGRYVMMQRTKRQHYNLVLVELAGARGSHQARQRRGLNTAVELPDEALVHWRLPGCEAAEERLSQSKRELEAQSRQEQAQARTPLKRPKGDHKPKATPQSSGGAEGEQHGSLWTAADDKVLRRLVVTMGGPGAWEQKAERFGPSRSAGGVARFELSGHAMIVAMILLAAVHSAALQWGVRVWMEITTL
jgi:hypothetical protein